MNHRREKDSFSNTPLGYAHGLSIINKYLAGSTPRKANHPVVDVTDESTLMDRNDARHGGA
jgi:hypothetical protein